MRRGIDRSTCALALGVMLLLHAWAVCSKPMDTRAFEQLNGLEEILGAVVCEGKLDRKHADMVLGRLLGDSSILFCMAAYIAGEAPDESGEILKELRERVPVMSPRSASHAFASMAVLKLEIRNRPEKEKVSLILALEQSEDHYLRIDAAKELMRLDKPQAIELLVRMKARRESVFLHSESSRLLRKARNERFPGNARIGGPQYGALVERIERSQEPGYCKHRR